MPEPLAPIRTVMSPLLFGGFLREENFGDPGLIRPPSNVKESSTMSAKRSIRCSAITIVIPNRFKEERSFLRRSEPDRSSAENGSSSSNSLEPETRPAAMARRCCHPAESECGSSFNSSCNSNFSATSPTRMDTSDLENPCCTRENASSSNTVAATKLSRGNWFT
ncbi:unannotated protein [freshwater metagenome]|uniref:Unannotated protein n=1 Tax=freshwater metagenome TaxID=449393 RepID=A0A6J6HLK2_9ZZZZ